MEIGDYLRVIRRRLWVLVLVPVLAAAIVAAVVLLRPPQYHAVATVAAPALVGGSSSNQYSGLNGVRVFVANFTAAITSPQVVSKVAEQTHASEKTLKKNLSAHPIADSSLIEVTYVSSDKALVASVVRTASGETIKFLFQSQVDLARRSVDGAEKAVSAAKKKIADFASKTGVVNPEQTYELKERSLLQLQQRRLDAQVAGETSAAATLGAAIEDAQAELAGLVPQVTAYRDLVQQTDQAEARRNDLQRSLEQLLAQSRAADPRGVVSVGDPEQLSRLAAFIRQGGVAVAAGLFLAIATVFLLEVARRPSTTAEPDLDRVPVVGHLPWSEALRSASSKVLADVALLRAGESLLLNVATELGGRMRGVFIVTSPPGKHGKTVVSTMLSTLLARTGHHVLLVGTHRDYPLHARRPPDSGNGRNVTRSEWMDSDDALHSWLSGLWALENRQWSLPAWQDRKGGLLPAVRLAEIVSEARDLFDVVIVDSPSYLGREVLATLTWVADGVLVVVSNADGPARMRRSAQSFLNGLSVPFAGVVLNQIKDSAVLADSTAHELPPRPDRSR